MFRKLIPLEDLTPENVLYWRCVCEYLKSKGEEGEDLLEQLLPEPAIYADYLLRYIAFKNKSLGTEIDFFFFLSREYLFYSTIQVSAKGVLEQWLFLKKTTLFMIFERIYFFNKKHIKQIYNLKAIFMFSHELSAKWTARSIACNSLPFKISE